MPANSRWDLIQGLKCYTLNCIISGSVEASELPLYYTSIGIPDASMFMMAAVMNAKFLLNMGCICFRLISCAVSFTSATQGASLLSGNV